MKSDRFSKLDSLLDGALWMVTLVERDSASQLTDDQRYWMVVHSMYWWSWTHKPTVMSVTEVGAFLSTTGAESHRGFYNYLEQKYGLEVTPEGTTPIMNVIGELEQRMKESHYPFGEQKN